MYIVQGSTEKLKTATSMKGNVEILPVAFPREKY